MRTERVKISGLISRTHFKKKERGRKWFCLTSGSPGRLDSVNRDATGFLKKLKTTLSSEIFFLFLSIGAPLTDTQHDVLFEATALHHERIELIYLRSGPAASFRGIPR